LWDVASGKQLHCLKGHTANVNSVAFSRDGRRAQSGSGETSSGGPADNTVRLWDLDAGRELRCFKGHTMPVYSVAFARDGRRALSGGQDGSVRQWDLEGDSSREAHLLLPLAPDTTHAIRAVASAPDGEALVAAGADGRIVHWNAEGEKVGECRLPGPVYGLAFAGDSRHLATANSNGTVYILRLPAPPAPAGK
jgi:WD40 repeat protein